MRNIPPKWFFLLLPLLFGFRLLMGLSQFSDEDEFQIYLIGLKTCTSGTYPYFGPDVVYSASQIPGGLQGLLVALPIQALGIPEAPYLLLNTLSFAALLFFGWYLTRRIPGVPHWFVYLWIMTAPWTLEFSTHIENPSYVLPGAVLFFIAVFELSHLYDSKLIDERLSFFFLGFSLFWTIQLHLSWVLMLPFLLLIIYRNKNQTRLLWHGLRYFLLGAALPISTLLPTLFKYGSSGGVENNVVVNLDNLAYIPAVFTRFLSFASYELVRFIGVDNAERLNFINKHSWVLPFLLIALLTGIFQVLYGLYRLVRKSGSEEMLRAKRFALGSILLVCIAFLFSITQPASHAFHILFPVSMWYTMYCYQDLFKRRITPWVILFLVSGILFQTSLFLHRLPTKSLFAWRDKVKEALVLQDYTIVGTRRESTVYLAHRPETWQPCAADTPDTLKFCAGFEFPDPYFVPQYVVHQEHYSGSHACKIDSIQPFGAGFDKPWREIRFPRKLSVNFYAKTKHPDDFMWVYEIKGPPQNIWKGYSMSGKISGGEAWQPVHMDLDLPEHTDSSAVFHLYFWMPPKTGARLYVDDMELAFY